MTIKVVYFWISHWEKDMLVWYESKVPQLYIHAYDANGFKVQKRRS